MRKIRLLVTLLCLWLGMMPLVAQSVQIIKELEQNPFASAVVLYKNDFGSFEKPDLIDTFPYAVIRMHLEGDAHDVRTAKERLTLDVGQMFRVESRVTTYTNQIVFLVKAKRLYMLIDCGDGCEKVVLNNMEQLKSNCVYDCTVRFFPEEGNIIGGTDKEELKSELLAEIAVYLQEQKDENKALIDTKKQTTGLDKSFGFSISKTKKIIFSSGNLQYRISTDEWRFAPNQIDYIGVGSKNISSIYYRGWVDLFGWSGSEAVAKWGVSSATGNSKYRGAFLDWGINKIGNDDPNIWRTLTKDEWNYIINLRTNAERLISFAQINGIKGIVLLPDNWTTPNNMIDLLDVNGFYSSVGNIELSNSQWKLLEVEGAVFLPTAGCRRGVDVYYVQYKGVYWTSTLWADNYPDCFSFSFDDEQSIGFGADDRSRGMSVRLVKDL